MKLRNLLITFSLSFTLAGQALASTTSTKGGRIVPIFTINQEDPNGLAATEKLKERVVKPLKEKVKLNIPDAFALPRASGELESRLRKIPSNDTLYLVVRMNLLPTPQGKCHISGTTQLYHGKPTIAAGGTLDFSKSVLMRTGTITPGEFENNEVSAGLFIQTMRGVLETFGVSPYDIRSFLFREFLSQRGTSA